MNTQQVEKVPDALQRLAARPATDFGVSGASRRGGTPR